MPNELQPSSGKAWRKENEGVLIELPSGKRAVVRGVTIQLLVRLGRIPDGLTPLVADIMLGKADEFPAPTNADELKTRFEFIDAVCATAFVKPRIVDKPKTDDEIALSDVEDIDREYVFDFLGRSTRELENFRHQQTDDVESLVSTEGHAKASKRTVKPPPVGEGENGA